MRDWLRLLSFEVETVRFGCYRPAVRSAEWLERFSWVDPLGEKWWPHSWGWLLLVAVKRVHGMRSAGARMALGPQTGGCHGAGGAKVWAAWPHAAALITLAALRVALKLGRTSLFNQLAGIRFESG